MDPGTRNLALFVPHMSPTAQLEHNASHASFRLCCPISAGGGRFVAGAADVPGRARLGGMDLRYEWVVAQKKPRRRLAVLRGRGRPAGPDTDSRFPYLAASFSMALAARTIPAIPACSSIQST